MGCSEEYYSGLGSVDLHVTSITFRDSDPATITGTLASGKPAEFIRVVDAPQVKGISVRFSIETDTTGLNEVNNTVSFPLQVELNQFIQEETVAEFQLDHAGLSWTPSYALRADTGVRRVYASALVNNTTAQTWQADTVRFINPENGPVTTATGRIAIRPGSFPIPWWNAVAAPPEAKIVYGWPVHGKWNPMIAVYCPAAGRVEEWTGSIYQRGDTLWFPADSLLELNLTWEQQPREYHCLMEAVSLTDSTMNWTIQWPDQLPRGADITPGLDSFELHSRESVTILYREVY